MKSLILSTLIAVLAVIATACGPNRADQAQALLLQSIEWSDGAPPEGSREAALKYAEQKGFKPSTDGNGLSEREVIMAAGRELCKQILTEYPNSPAAVKAAELRANINSKLTVIANQRIQSLFRDPNE